MYIVISLPHPTLWTVKHFSAAIIGTNEQASTLKPVNVQRCIL